MWAPYVFNKRIEMLNLEMYTNSIIFIHFKVYKGLDPGPLPGILAPHKTSKFELNTNWVAFLCHALLLPCSCWLHVTYHNC